MLQNGFRSRQFLAAALVTWLFAAGRLGAGDVDPLVRKVSLRHVAAPLSTILPTLEGEDLLLHLGPEFAEAKASIIVRDRPLNEVLDRIAQVFGAEWKPIGKAPLQLSLRRTRPVTEWLKAWKETREEAELRARAIQEARVRSGLSEAFAALDEPLPTDSRGRETPPRGVVDIALTRFLKTLSPSDIDALVRFTAAVTPVRTGGRLSEMPSPLIRPFRDLTNAQKEMVRAWLTNGRGTPVRPVYQRRLDSLDDTVLEFGTYQGVAVQIIFHTPYNERYNGVAAGVSISADKMEDYLHQEHFRLLSKRRTPAGALLGATPQEDGTVSPMVSVEDALLTAKGVEKLPETPLQKEFSPSVADELKLNLVSDHFTRSKRYRPEGERAVRAVLEKAMSGYESVARQQGAYLLVRSVMWPDRDEEEIPGTQAEKWIAAKQSGAGLGVDDFALMNRLPERQLDGLASYLDLPLHLRAEVFLVRRHRWLLSLLDALPKTQQSAARSKAGLALNRMSLRNRVFLLRSAGYNGSQERLSFFVVEQASPLRQGERSFTAYLMQPGASGPVWASN